MTSTALYYSDGVYKCRVLEQGFTVSATKGTPEFFLKLLVLERIEPAADDVEQFSRVAYFAITDKTADWVMHDLHTLGFKGDDFRGVDPRAEGYHSFVGNEIEMRCSQEPDQNKVTRERWGLRPAMRVLDADRMWQLNRFLTKKPNAGAALPKAHSDGISEEDVPF